MANSSVRNSDSISIVGKRKAAQFTAELPNERIKRRTIEVLKRDSGKFVQFDESPYGYGILVGSAFYNGSVSYVLIDKDRDLTFHPIDTYTYLDDIPANLSVLYYLWNNNRHDLCQSAHDKLEKVADEVIAPIYVPAEFRPRNNNTSRRKNSKASKK